MILIAAGSRFRPFAKAIFASATRWTSLGDGSHVCGSAPFGTSEDTSTRSPPISRTKSVSEQRKRCNNSRRIAAGGGLAAAAVRETGGYEADREEPNDT